jgi:hypothetical protein
LTGSPPDRSYKKMNNEDLKEKIKKLSDEIKDITP